MITMTFSMSDDYAKVIDRLQHVSTLRWNNHRIRFELMFSERWLVLPSGIELCPTVSVLDVFVETKFRGFGFFRSFLQSLIRYCELHYYILLFRNVISEPIRTYLIQKHGFIPTDDPQQIYRTPCLPPSLIPSTPSSTNAPSWDEIFGR